MELPVNFLRSTQSTSGLYESASFADAAGTGEETTSSQFSLWKTWGLKKIRIAKQLYLERLGQLIPTSDPDLDTSMATLVRTQETYKNLLKLIKSLTAHLNGLVLVQQQLSIAFNDMAVRSPDLHRELSLNADTQKALTKNGLTLVGAMLFFTDNVQTLTYKTIEDTLQSWHAYSVTRLNFDTERAEIPRNEARLAAELLKYETSRAALHTKLRLLDANKVLVMRKQLTLFHGASCAYFTGNQAALERILSEMHIAPVKLDALPAPSFLEKLQETAVTSFIAL